MTDREYLEKMVALTEQLNEAAKSRPYDPDTYNSIIDEIQRVHAAQFRRLRRQPSLMLLFIALLLCFLAWLILEILF